MSAKVNYFKIGIFVIIATALGVAAIVALGAGTFFREIEMAETYVDESVQGLEIGAAVRLRGVRVGTVKEISFVRNFYPAAADPKNEIPYVLIRFTLHPEKFRGESKLSMGPILQRRIREHGLRCKLSPQGLTGLLYLEVDHVANADSFTSLTLTWTPDPAYHYIPSIPSLITRMSEAIEVLMGQIGQVLAKLEALSIEPVIQDLQALILNLSKQVGEAKVGQLRDEAVELLGNLRASSEAFQDLLKKPEIDRILKGAADTAEAAASTVQAAGKTIEQTREKATQLLDGLLEASQKINLASDRINAILKDEDLPEAAAHLNNTLRQLDKMVSRQQQNIEEILENIRRITENLKDVTREAKDNPSGVIFSQPPKPVQLENRK